MSHPPPFPLFLVPPQVVFGGGRPGRGGVLSCVWVRWGRARAQTAGLFWQGGGWREGGRLSARAHTHTHAHTYIGYPKKEKIKLGYPKQEKIKLFLQDDVAWEDRVWGGKTKFVTWWWGCQDRGKTSGRDDDNIEAIKKRFKVTPREISNA